MVQNFTGRVTTSTTAATTVQLANEAANQGTNPDLAVVTHTVPGQPGTYQTAGPVTYDTPNDILVRAIELSTDSANAIDVRLESGTTVLWEGEVTAAQPVRLGEGDLVGPAGSSSVTIPPGTAFNLVVAQTAAAQAVDYDVGVEIV